MHDGFFILLSRLLTEGQNQETSQSEYIGKKEVAFLPAKNSIVESDVRICNYVNMYMIKLVDKRYRKLIMKVSINLIIRSTPRSSS